MPAHLKCRVDSLGSERSELGGDVVLGRVQNHIGAKLLCQFFAILPDLRNDHLVGSQGLTNRHCKKANRPHAGDQDRAVLNRPSHHGVDRISKSIEHARDALGNDSGCHARILGGDYRKATKAAIDIDAK